MGTPTNNIIIKNCIRITMSNKEKISVVDKRKLYKVEQQLQDNERKLNDLCGQLAKVDGFFPLQSVSGLRKINSKWLRTYIDGILSSIKSDQRLPQSFKEDITQRWEKVCESAKDICDQISLIANFTGVSLRKNKGRFVYDAQELKAFAEKEATMILTDEQTEYLSMLQAVAKSLNQASQWEKAHGYFNTTANGTNVRAGGEYRHISLFDLLTDGKGSYGIAPQSFVLMLNDGVIGKEKDNG